MHAEKIRTADLPAFRLEPRDAAVVMGFVGFAAYILGFFLGLTF